MRLFSSARLLCESMRLKSTSIACHYRLLWMEDFFLFSRLERDFLFDVEVIFGVDKADDVIARGHFDLLWRGAVIFAVDIDVRRRLAVE